MALTLATTVTQAVRTIHTEFNDDGLADLVIRTRDADFQVHKWPLKHSSSIFKDMLSLPQWGVINSERDVVEITEDSKIVQYLLSVIYLHRECEITTIDDLSLFAHAAVKYDITPAILRTKTVMRQFLSRRYAVLRVYTLAIKFNFDIIADRAFRLCMCIRLANPYHFEEPVLRDLPMENYQQLLFSKTQRGELASSIVGKHFRFASWCESCKRHGCGWWDEYILMVMLRLKEKPTSDVLFEKVIMDSCFQHKCPHEMSNLAHSEAYFTVVKAEIDALPWIYNAADFMRCKSVELEYYHSFTDAVEGAQKAQGDEEDSEAEGDGRSDTGEVEEQLALL